jgi:hypothetical protein
MSIARQLRVRFSSLLAFPLVPVLDYLRAFQGNKAASHHFVEERTPLHSAQDDGGETPSHLEAFTEIKLTADRIVDEEIFRAFALHPAIENQVRAVHD